MNRKVMSKNKCCEKKNLWKSYLSVEVEFGHNCSYRSAPIIQERTADEHFVSMSSIRSANMVQISSM